VDLLVFAGVLFALLGAAAQIWGVDSRDWDTEGDARPWI
jgi:hypothetical protein